MQLNCVWIDSILRVCSTSLLAPICDVKPQLIPEKQIKPCKLNSPAFPLAQGVSRTCRLPAYSLPLQPNPHNPPQAPMYAFSWQAIPMELGSGLPLLGFFIGEGFWAPSLGAQPGFLLYCERLGP